MTFLSTVCLRGRGRRAMCAVLYISAVCVFGARGSAQITDTLYSVADNTIYSDNTNNSNGQGSACIVGKTASAARRGLIRFNLSAIPGNMTITAATLQLVCVQVAANSPQSQNVALHRASRSWGEGNSNASSQGQGVAAASGDATWDCAFADGLGTCDTAWSTGGGDYTSTASATTSVSGTGTYTWTSSGLLSDVTAWYAAPSTNDGWLLIGDESSTAVRTAKWFASREATGNVPMLIVTYTSTLPVELAAFSARREAGGVALRWHAASEVNLLRYDVERQVGDGNWQVQGSRSGAANPDAGATYHFMDAAAPQDRALTYRLRMIDRDGSFEFSPQLAVQSAQRGGSAPSLDLAPVPTRGTGTARLTLAAPSVVSMYVVDMLGRRQAAVIEGGMLQAGTHLLLLPASTLRPGRYLVLAECNGAVFSTPLLIVE